MTKDSGQPAPPPDRRRLVLVVLDGWGYSPVFEGNAIANARTGHFARLWQENPHTLLQASGEAVGLPRDALQPSLDVLRDHGNMSSPTVLFVIEMLRRERAPRPCVAVGFGPGLAGESALLV